MPEEDPPKTAADEFFSEVAEKLAAQFRDDKPTFVRVDRESKDHFAVIINPQLVE